MNEMESRKKIVLIIPSDIVARGFESILSGQGDFLVLDNLVDYSKPREVRLRILDPDVVIVDPAVFDFRSRKDGRFLISEQCDATVLALEGPAVTEDILRQYDGAVSLYDDAAGIVRKIHSAMDSRLPEPSGEGNELSSREKEILVCVAQGMLNKEIARQVQSLYLHGHNPPQEHHAQDRHQDRGRPYRLCDSQQLDRH